MTDSPETVEQERLTDDRQGQGPTTEPGQEPAASNGAAGPVAGPPYETPEEMAARVKELTTDLQRLQAEYVNYKRRVDRDRDLVLQNAKFSILSALLPVLDDVDRAREHEELSGGFKAVADSLERIVAGEGLVKFGAHGDPFDPRLHEALMHSLSPDVTSTTCDKVVQAGYQFGDRVVRPALVTVVDPDPDALDRGSDLGSEGSLGGAGDAATGVRPGGDSSGGTGQDGAGQHGAGPGAGPGSASGSSGTDG